MFNIKSIVVHIDQVPDILSKYNHILDMSRINHEVVVTILEF